MKYLVFVMIMSFTFILISDFVFSACIRPVLSRDINSSAHLCGENFVLNDGIIISNDNLIIDCSSAVLKGDLFGKSTGILIEDRKNITLYDCRIINYATGIIVKNSSNIMLYNMTFLRNLIGLWVIDSTDIDVIQGFDISLLAPVKVSNSINSFFHFYNKKILGDFCWFNFCANENV